MIVLFGAHTLNIERGDTQQWEPPLIVYCASLVVSLI